MTKRAKRVKYATSQGQRQVQRIAIKTHIISLLCAIIIITGLVWFYHVLTSPTFLPIEHVKVDGEHGHVDQARLVSDITPLVQHGFFDVDINAIVAQVKRQPWVANVHVKRIWPSTIRITIEERKPVARWRDDQLLTSDGVLFKPAVMPDFAQLPQFNGPDELVTQMWVQYQKMQSLLSPVQLKIKEVTLTSRRSWDIVLDNGLHMTLGKENVLVRLNRFVAIYPQISNNKLNNAYVDLRYTNGFALKSA